MKKFAIALVGLCFAISVPVFAGDMEAELEVTRDVMGAQKKALIAESLELDKETAEKFWPIYNELQNDLRKVADKQVAIIKEYADSFDTLTDDQAMDLIKRAMKVDEERLKVRKGYIRKFEKIMPGKMVARYYQAENKVEAIVNFGLAQQIPLIPQD